MATPGAGHSLIVVAKRLPVKWCDGSWQPAPDGFVSALAMAVRAESGAWIGLPGDVGDTFAPFEFDQMELVPVALTRGEYRACFEGFSKSILWPLYHDRIVAPEYHRAWWRVYKAINSKFAQAAVEAAGYGATIWVHDYHLQLVPLMIRMQRPDVRIGFFNHIPFPPVELFAQMPWREEVVEGLLGADVIGFQREGDADNFRESVKCFANVACDPLSRRIGAFPISIDVDAINSAAKTEAVTRTANQMRHDLGDPEVLILGIDRLDYTKGILHRLRAFEELLDDGLLDPNTATFLQVAVPPREGTETYHKLRDEVERLVGHINGRFAPLSGDIVNYSHRSSSFENTVALYLAADVLVVSSLREGMNLTAKEFVTARQSRDGALVLSEFAGAADELEEAIIVNPHDIKDLKSGVLKAATMGADEGRKRIASMAATVESRDAHYWVQNFLTALRPASRLSVTSVQTKDNRRGRTRTATAL